MVDAAAFSRRDEEQSLCRFRFEDAEFDESRLQLTVAGQPAVLEPKPLRVLQELLHHPNEVVTREELFETVWDGRPTVDNVLANAILKLRKALGDRAGARIVTVPRVGYRFEGGLERAVVATQASSELELAAHQTVPNAAEWVLRERLSLTGRSEVWLARHAKLGISRVFKFASNGEQLRFLKREYTLFKVLHSELGPRPDIGALVGCNFEAPPFFLASDYAGQNLAAWSEANLAGLAMEQRLKIGLRVAQAVAAAHGVGVLHKDLKPANVLVREASAGEVQIRLIDFGSGRALDLERVRELAVSLHGLSLTQQVATDSLTGTPLYLAPELIAGGSPSVRSDLFALGLLLYQLLAGDMRRPMSVGWERDIGDALLVEDIRAATQGRPEDRPSSVQAWVDQLQALEARRQEQARAQVAAAEQAQRAAAALRTQARKPWVMAAVGSLLIGLVATTAFGVQAQRAEASARAEADRAKSVSDFLNDDVFAVADVLRDGALRPQTMLDVVRASAERVHDRFNDNPAVEAAVRKRLARTFTRLAASNDALRQYDAAMEARQRFAGRVDDEVVLMQLEKGVIQIAAEPEVLVQAWGALRSGGHQELLRRTDAVGIAALRLRANLLIEDERWAEALKSTEQAIERARQLPNYEMVELRELLAMRLACHFGLGTDAAVESDLKALEETSTHRKHAALLAMTRASIRVAGKDRDAKRFDRAHGLLIHAIEKVEGAPDFSPLHLGDLYSEVGHVENQRSRFDAASEAYLKAAGLFEKGLGAEHQYTQITMVNAAGALNETGQSAKATKILLERRAWFNAHASSGRWAPLEFKLARAYLQTGRLKEARVVLDQFKSPTGDRIQDDEEWERWIAEGWRGKVLMALGQVDEGRRMARHAYLGLKDTRFDSGDVQYFNVD